MARYGREYRSGGFWAGPRYDLGYGAGGYSQGLSASSPGSYQGDYEGVAYGWGAGGFYGGPGYADPDRGIHQGYQGRRGYGVDYRDWVRGGYPDEETWGGPYSGHTCDDSGYCSQMPRWPWEGARG